MNAAAGGRVAYVGDDIVGQGLTVLIVHREGWRTVYGHLGSATVQDGADVRAGQQIGTVKVTLDGKVIAEAPLVAVAAVEQAGFFKRLWDSFWMWWESE